MLTGTTTSIEVLSNVFCGRVAIGFLQVVSAKSRVATSVGRSAICVQYYATRPNPGRCVVCNRQSPTSLSLPARFLAAAHPSGTHRGYIYDSRRSSLLTPTLSLAQPFDGSRIPVFKMGPTAARPYRLIPLFITAQLDSEVSRIAS